VQHSDLFARAAASWGKKLSNAAGSPKKHHWMFDATRSRALRLFAAVVRGEDGTSSSDVELMGAQEFRTALEAERFQLGTPDPLLHEVFDVLAEGGGSIDASMFHAALQRLKLEVLAENIDVRLRSSGDVGSEDRTRGWHLDWSPAAFSRDVIRSDNLKQLMLTPRPPQFQMRWRHIDDPDPFTLLCLGVKYQLHLDALSIFKGDRLEARVWKHGDDYHLLIPVSRLTPASRASHLEYEQQRQRLKAQRRDPAQPKCGLPSRIAVEVEKAHLYLVLCGCGDTLFSMASSWHPAVGTNFRVPAKGNKKNKRRLAEDLINLSRHGKPSSPVGTGSDFDFRRVVKITSLFDDLVATLEIDYSELRIGDVCRLVSGVLRAVVRHYRAIHDAYWARLEWFEAHLDEQAAAEIVGIQKGIEVVKWRLDQLSHVVQRLMTYDFCDKEVKCYFEFVADDAASISSFMAREMSLCDKLLDLVKVQQDAKETHAGYSITLMVTLLWPFQFLTGVYGMNFQDEEGKGTVPILGDLTLERSYYMFWCLGAGITMCLALWFRHAGLL